MLVGMKNANIHPKPIQQIENLVLYESNFGTVRVLGGSHHLLEATDKLNFQLQMISHANIKNTRVIFNRHNDPGIDFFTTEEFGVKLPRSCDRCKNCKNCSSDVHRLSRIEQKELAIIEENLVLDPLENKWHCC